MYIFVGFKWDKSLVSESDTVLLHILETESEEFDDLVKNIREKTMKEADEAIQRMKHLLQL